ncbi:MAG: hypothetical protein ACREPM_07520 [Gemmatimonadaceae bacterium]
MESSSPAAPNDIPTGAPFDAWRLRPLAPSEFAVLGREEQLQYLAALALVAPTTHNTVPQRMRSDTGRMALHFALDRRAILPQSDASGRQAAVSLGAAIANAWIAAEVCGFRPTLALEADAESFIRPGRDGEAAIVPVATLVLENANAAAPSRDASWVTAMLRRKMVRAEFDERVRLEASLASELAAITSRIHPGLTLHLITDAPTLLALGKFQELADSTVINRAPFARELAEWLVENESDGPVGMRGREFGLSDDSARRFHDGLAGAGPLLPDETVAFAKAGNLGMRSSSAVMVVTVARDDLEHRLAAGRAFEEMALRLTIGEMCVAMHAGITEVEAPNLALRGRLRTFQRPTVVFRAGRPLRSADGDRPHSARPRLRDVGF